MACVLLHHLGREQMFQPYPDRTLALRELALSQISDHGVAARANAAKLEDRDVLEHEPHGLAHEASLERAMHPIVIPTPKSSAAHEKVWIGEQAFISWRETSGAKVQSGNAAEP